MCSRGELRTRYIIKKGIQMLKQFLILFFLIDVLIVGTCFASNEKTLANGTIEKKEKVKDFLDSLKFYLNYSVQSDFAEELKPRLYSHLISTTLNYKLNSAYSLNLSSSFRYNSLDRKILLKNGSYGFNDLNVSLSRKILLGDFLSASNSSVLRLASAFPLSEESRLEGHKAIPSLSFSINSDFFDGKYTLGNNFSYHYVINTYEYSPSSGVANNRDSFSYSMSHSIELIKRLTFKLGFGFRYSKNTKGESDYSYNNSQSINYSFSKLHLGVSYHNGGFTNDGDVSLWYIDKYRRNLKANLGYSF